MFITVKDISTGTLREEPLNIYSINYIYTKEEKNEKLLIFVLINGLRKIEGYSSDEELQERLDELSELTGGGGLIQVDTYGDLPEKGNKGTIYITKDTGQTYYWDENTSDYITTGTSGKTGIYTTTEVLPTTFGTSITLDKSKLVELVAPTVAYSEGSEIISTNSVHAVITGSTSTEVSARVVADNVIDSFIQVDKVADLPVQGQANVLYAIKDIKEFRAWDDDLSVYYTLPEISMDEDLIVECEQGDYKINDEIKEGTSLLTIIKKMLTKTYYPAFTNPSATLTATGAKLLECGSTLNTTFTVTFNQGTINPAYGTNGKRAGAANGYSLNGGTAQTGNTFTETISESNKGPFTATVTYDEGPQPKDSHGENYQSPLPAGSITTGQVKYEFVNALYANTSNIATVSKLSLISKSASPYTFNFPAQTATQPEIFEVPADWNITAVEMLNTLNNQWESVIWEFDTSNVTHQDASGATVNYVRYTDNRGYAAGDRKVRIKFN